jgi:steroid 5-alpha reductase family enzyme
MAFIEIYLWGFPVIMIMMTLVWVVSVVKKNAGIVDPFWGLGFVLVAAFYFWQTNIPGPRAIVVMVLVAIWGLRLWAYLMWRNWGQDEDYRYKQFRKNYGEHRYWWFSFFQVFLLQGFLMWLISATLLGAMLFSGNNPLTLIDVLAVLIWIIGFSFEAGGDHQLARFKANPANKGKLLDTGFWKYTRHPNYFGDAAVWWGFALFAVVSGSYITILGSLLMTALLLKVSGVALLEKSLKEKKPGYQQYMQKTSAFIPWFPKKRS